MEEDEERLLESSEFNPKALMPLQNYFHIISLKSTENHMEYLQLTGILFNHESPVRGETFVLEKYLEL